MPHIVKTDSVEVPYVMSQALHLSITEPTQSQPSFRSLSSLRKRWVEYCLSKSMWQLDKGVGPTFDDT